MAIVIDEIAPDVTRVALSGRIDYAGAQQMEAPMSEVSRTRRAVVIDLSSVEFIASMGLHCLMISAKTIIGKGGRMVLLSPGRLVADVIAVSGIGQLVPILHDQEAAIAAVAL